MNTPFEVVHDNLATRSIRVSIDLVDDEVHQALSKVLVPPSRSLVLISCLWSMSVNWHRKSFPASILKIFIMMS